MFKQGARIREAETAEGRVQQGLYRQRSPVNLFSFPLVSYDDDDGRWQRKGMMEFPAQKE